MDSKWAECALPSGQASLSRLVGSLASGLVVFASRVFHSMVIGFSGIRSFFARHPHVKTSFFWSRCKWLHQKARADGKCPLLLNLDETVVPLEFKHVRVNLIHKSGGEKIKGLPKQNEQYERTQEVVLHVHLVLE